MGSRRGSHQGRQSVAVEFLSLGQEKEAQLHKFLDEYQLGPGAYQLTGLYPEGAVSRRRLKRFEIKLMGTATLNSSDGELKTKRLTLSRTKVITLSIIMECDTRLSKKLLRNKPFVLPDESRGLNKERP